MKSPFDLDYQNDATDGRIVAALEKISQAFRVLLWNEGKDYSLSPVQLQVLVFLLHHSPEKRKVSYLAKEFNMTKATISDTVKSLEEKKLIKKETDSSDTRSYSISLTEKGKTISRQSSLFANELLNPLQQWNENEKTNFLLNLFDIIRHLNKSGIIGMQRMCFTCTHYQQDKNQKHFCKLLNIPLRQSDLRIDCPEHASAE